jgi:predicted ester cyclase
LPFSFSTRRAISGLGPNVGRPPTNRKVEISELAIYRMVDGKIAEQWVNPDTQSLLKQLYGDEQ